MTVAAGQPFDATIGLSSLLDPSIFTTVFDLPPGDLTLVVHVTADGIDLLPGQTWRNDLPIAGDANLPAVTLRLVAEEQEQESREARIQALYLHDGQAVGFGSRNLAVVRDAGIASELDTPSLPTGGTLAFTTTTPAPDLTVDIRRGRFPGELMWVFHTDHGLGVPDDAPVRNVGTEPKEYARQLIARANQREGTSDLFAFLRGIGAEISENVPPVLFTLLRDIAAKLDRPPLVQLFSEEPYIPWELAWMKVPLDPGVPGFLGAQACVGRWIMAEDDPPFPAPASASGDRMAAIWGVYEGFPGWQRLVAAEDEGKQLAERYGAEHVGANLDDVMACIKGTPRVDVLHFAVHGNYDPQGNQNGLVLTDRRVLDPTVVRGLPLAGRPFVFLNACQVGTANEVLGDYGGLAMAFVKQGACGVVAPLWSINDEIAAELALSFYEKVRDGESPASVLREARGEHGPEPTGASGTTFAYQFFGHPAMKLRVRAQPEPKP